MTIPFKGVWFSRVIHLNISFSFSKRQKQYEFLNRSPIHLIIVWVSETWVRALKTPCTMYCRDFVKTLDNLLSLFICTAGITVPQNLSLHIKWNYVGKVTSTGLHFLFSSFSSIFNHHLGYQSGKLERFLGGTVFMLCYCCWIFWEGRLFRR